MQVELFTRNDEQNVNVNVNVTFTFDATVVVSNGHIFFHSRYSLLLGIFSLGDRTYKERNLAKTAGVSEL